MLLLLAYDNNKYFCDIYYRNDCNDHIYVIFIIELIVRQARHKLVRRKFDRLAAYAGADAPVGCNWLS